MPNKIKKQISGGAVDESLLERSRKKIADLGGPENLSSCIAKLLGRYRAMRDYRDTAPTTSETVKHLNDTAAIIEKLKANIDLMPEIVEGNMWELLYRTRAKVGTNLTNILVENLTYYQLLCKKLEKEFKKAGSRKGEKPKLLEHELLSDVALMIEKIDGIGKAQAADYAAEILISEGVQNIPNWEKTRGSAARDAVVAYRKKATPQE